MSLIRYVWTINLLSDLEVPYFQTNAEVNSKVSCRFSLKPIHGELYDYIYIYGCEPEFGIYPKILVLRGKITINQWI